MEKHFNANNTKSDVLDAWILRTKLIDIVFIRCYSILSIKRQTNILMMRTKSVIVFTSGFCHFSAAHSLILSANLNGSLHKTFTHPPNKSQRILKMQCSTKEVKKNHRKKNFHFLFIHPSIVFAFNSANSFIQLGDACNLLSIVLHVFESECILCACLSFDPRVCVCARLSWSLFFFTEFSSSERVYQTLFSHSFDTWTWCSLMQTICLYKNHWQRWCYCCCCSR